MRMCCVVENSTMMGTNIRFENVYKCKNCGTLWARPKYVKTEEIGNLIVRRVIEYD